MLLYEKRRIPEWSYFKIKDDCFYLKQLHKSVVRGATSQGVGEGGWGGVGGILCPPLKIEQKRHEI